MFELIRKEKAFGGWYVEGHKGPIKGGTYWSFKDNPAWSVSNYNKKLLVDEKCLTEYYIWARPWHVEHEEYSNAKWELLKSSQPERDWLEMPYEFYVKPKNLKRGFRRQCMVVFARFGVE